MPTLDPINTAWMDQALCRDADPEMFFPTNMQDPHLSPGRGAYKAARRICERCTEADKCLMYRLATVSGHDDNDGMWGGMSPAERKKYRRQLRRMAA